MDAIRAERLTKFYGRSRGVSQLDLAVACGEVFGFLGLVLVKSWLLAIPHLIIVGLFTGSVAWAGAVITPSGRG